MIAERPRPGTRFGVYIGTRLLGTFDTRDQAESLVHPGFGRHVAEVEPAR